MTRPSASQRTWEQKQSRGERRSAVGGGVGGTILFEISHFLEGLLTIKSLITLLRIKKKKKKKRKAVLSRLMLICLPPSLPPHPLPHPQPICLRAHQSARGKQAELPLMSCADVRGRDGCDSARRAGGRLTFLLHVQEALHRPLARRFVVLVGRAYPLHQLLHFLLGAHKVVPRLCERAAG